MKLYAQDGLKYMKNSRKQNWKVICQKINSGCLWVVGL